MTRITLPDWLFVPPASVSQPPRVPLAQSLPFEQLTWTDFERLILRVVSADQGVLDCRMYGVPGQAQHGIDLLAAPVSQPEELTCYQCKKVETFRSSDIRAAVKKFEDGPWAAQTKEFTLCAACPLESTDVIDQIVIERSRLAQRNIKLRVWDGSTSGELNVRLKVLPQVVDDFFGRAWVEAFNGQAVAETFGERLDGIDFARLRQRLSDLYQVIFAQHDPGLRRFAADQNNYLQRYVPADIVEQTSINQTWRANLERQHHPEEAFASSPDSEAQSDRTPTSQLGSLSLRRRAWDWLQDKQSCVVLGEPGHGKSALLRQLALLMNSDSLQEHSPLGTAHARRLPVWISFARFAAAIGSQPSISVADFFCTWLHQLGYGDIQALFRKSLRDCDFVFLVDGLDEGAEAAEGREALDRLVAFARSHRAIIVCTSRPRSFFSLPVPTSWPVATLAPLDDEQILQLATRWFAIGEGTASGESWDARWSRAMPRGEGFCAAIKASSRTHELARNPLLCQALIELYRVSHRLPEARGRAYAEIIDLFLRRHPQARAHAGYSEPPSTLEGVRDSDLQDILITIAFDTQSKATGGIASRQRCVELCVQYLENDVAGLGLSRHIARRRGPEIVDLLVSHFGVLIERSPGELSFVHLSLQEYLAARSVSSLADAEQLDWVLQIALQVQWRECLISWFGVQGEGGRKRLTTNACEVLADLGSTGEWERLEMLRLRTDLAVADLGLPVSESRTTIAQAAREVDVSQFAEVRNSLARSIAVGALGSSVQAECIATILRWCPGRSQFDREGIIKAMRSWVPAPDMRQTLERALYDESTGCRRAAAATLAEAYASDPTAAPLLSKLAMESARADVRAAAIHGMTRVPDWAAYALAAAKCNIGSQCPELVLACTTVLVRQNSHSQHDLENLLDLLTTNSLDYSLHGLLNRLICEGWPQDLDLRQRCLRFIERQHGLADLNFPVRYLLHSFPGDPQVAETIGSLFDRHGMHAAGHSGVSLKLLQTGFTGNPVVSIALRRALDEQKSRYSISLHWHPNTVPAFLVLADEQARDELLDGYADADAHGKYWIVSTLMQGWPEDASVVKSVRGWARESVAFAAPIAEFGGTVFDSLDERVAWLEHLVKEAEPRIVIRPLQALLNIRPDDKTWSLVMSRLADTKLWYFHRVTIEERLASLYPLRKESRAIVDCALHEDEDRSLSPLAGAFGHVDEVRSQLLAYAAPAPYDVRLAVATVLSERGGQFDLIERLTPLVRMEERSAVRAAALIARARACRHDPVRSASLVEFLQGEAMSIGPNMSRRKRTAIAALLEIGQVELVAKVFVSDKTSISLVWNEGLDPDPLSMRTLLDHWATLEIAIQAQGENAEFPVAAAVEIGLGPSLLGAPALRRQLDQYLAEDSHNWLARQRIELWTKLYPSGAELFTALLKELSLSDGELPRGRLATFAARIAGEHFGGDLSSLAQIVQASRTIDFASGSPGVLGHLVRSWPASDLAVVAQEVVPAACARWSPLDRLLCATHWERWPDASVAACDLLNVRNLHGYADREEIEALRIWAQTPGCMRTVAQWRDSLDDNQAMIALTLMALRQSLSADDVDWLKSKFDRICAERRQFPRDGYDASVGMVVPWLQKAYTLLSRAA